MIDKTEKLIVTIGSVILAIASITFWYLGKGNLFLLSAASCAVIALWLTWSDNV